MFGFVNAAIAACWLLRADAGAPCERWETDANLSVMPAGAELDVVFAGSSHGWAFTACRESALVVEEHFGPSTLNLSKKGSGPLPALCYLQAFYAQGNSAETLVYVIDPWAVAYRRWNEDAPFLHDEPFDAGFWLRAAMNGSSARQLAAGMRVKFTGSNRADLVRSDWCSRTLDAVQPETAATRRDYLYPGPFKAARVKEYGDVLVEIVETARANGTATMFVIPPTLLGPLTGHDTLCELLDQLEREFGARWLDASKAISEPSLYRDHDHLNANGIRRLFSDAFSPAVAEMSP